MINYLIEGLKDFINYLILTFGESGAVQLISSAIVLFSAYLAFVSTRKKTAIDIITKNRIDWTNLVRQKASEIIFLSHKIADILNLAIKNKNDPKNAVKMPNDYDEFANNMHTLNGLIIEFKLYFNPFDEKDKVVIDLLDEIDLKIDKYKEIEDYQNIVGLLKLFSTELSILLKNEWDRIKIEAGIKKSFYKKITKAYKYIMSLLNK